MERRPSANDRFGVMDSGLAPSARPGMTDHRYGRPECQEKMVPSALLPLRPDRARIALAPASRIDSAEEIAERLVEQRGLLDVHGVAAFRKHREAGRGDVFLEIDARLDAGI